MAQTEAGRVSVTAASRRVAVVAISTAKSLQKLLLPPTGSSFAEQRARVLAIASWR